MNVKIRYPLESDGEKSFQPKSISDKVYLLMQVALEGDNNLYENNFGLKSEANRILQSCSRIVKALEEYIYTDWRCVSATTLRAVSTVHRAIENHYWPDNQLGIFQQIPGIGHTLSKSLTENGIGSLEQLENTDARVVEKIVGRNSPFGNEIIERSKAIPKVYADLTPFRFLKATLELTIQYTIRYHSATCKKSKKNKFNSTLTVLVTDSRDQILAARKITMEPNESRSEFIRAVIDNEQSEYKIQLEVLPETWIGRDAKICLSLNDESLDKIAERGANHKRKDTKESGEKQQHMKKCKTQRKKTSQDCNQTEAAEKKMPSDDMLPNQTYCEILSALFVSDSC